jgi:hypothetical protein
MATLLVDESLDVRLACVAVMGRLIQCGASAIVSPHISDVMSKMILELKISQTSAKDTHALVSIGAYSFFIFAAFEASSSHHRACCCTRFQRVCIRSILLFVPHAEIYMGFVSELAAAYLPVVLDICAAKVSGHAFIWA